jgi:hypothetical protein
MVVKKTTTRSRSRKAASSNGKQLNWRDTLRRRLAKVREIEAIFAVQTKGLIHVFTVVAEHDSDVYDPLLRQESLIEKDHPSLAFDFHTREHQGRPPYRTVPFEAELVYLRHE